MVHAQFGDQRRALGEQPREVRAPAEPVEHVDERRSLVRGQVVEHPRGHHDRVPDRGGVPHRAAELLHRVPGPDLALERSRDVDGGPETFGAISLVGPDARLEPGPTVRVVEVDRLAIDADPRPDLGEPVGEHQITADAAFELDGARWAEVPEAVVAVVVPVQREVEPGARPHVHEGDRSGRCGEPRHQQRTTSHLVGLGRARGHEPFDLVPAVQTERPERRIRIRRVGIVDEVRVEASESAPAVTIVIVVVGCVPPVVEQQQVVDRGEQQHREPLWWRCREEQASDLGIVGDPGREPSVQRGPTPALDRSGRERVLQRREITGAVHARDRNRARIDSGLRGKIDGAMDLIADLDARGLIHDSTDRDALSARLGAGPVGAYVGFDPTADSLHVGHLMGQLALRRLQLAGHRPFPLAGGATGMVGDPGGRSEERNLLDADTLRHNVACIKGQLERILDFEPGPYAATLVDNADWTAALGVLEFLRDVGKHVTVNQMLAKESIKNRLEGEHGLSYTEFSYMLLQANDFRHLYEHHGVELQLGGSDQWGNIVAGIDLIRRTHGVTSHGLTWPLLLKSDGTKFGKTAGGAVWLDPDKTSPYQFRQFWVRTDDDAVADLLLRFSMRPVEELTALVDEHRAAPERRLAQRALASELTEVVHGADAAKAADAAAEVLFGSDPTVAPEAAFEVIASEVPTSRRSAADVDDLAAALVDAGLASSKGDARRTLDGRGYRVNGVPLEATDRLADLPRLHGRYLLVRRGKSSYHLLELAG